MLLYNVRDAFQLLKERGIARDKQEVRKWLNEGFIRADPPENRRVGWRIEAEALQTFIRRYENGEFETLMQRRKPALPPVLLRTGESAPRAETERRAVDPHMVRMEEEVLALRQQVKSLRREMNDLKKVLGFPVLAASTPSDGTETNS